MRVIRWLKNKILKIKVLEKLIKNYQQDTTCTWSEVQIRRPKKEVEILKTNKMEILKNFI